jgi:hypothetical protein
MKLYTLDETCLENARAGLKQPFSPLQLALSKLVSEAGYPASGSAGKRGT